MVKYISSGGISYNINIDQIPLDNSMLHIINRNANPNSLGEILTNIPSNILNIMQKYANEGVLDICSSIIESAKSLSSWSIPNDDLLELLKVLGIEYIYPDLLWMKISLEEKWAIKNRVYANAMFEYNYYNLIDLFTRYRIVRNGTRPGNIIAWNRITTTDNLSAYNVDPDTGEPIPDSRDDGYSLAMSLNHDLGYTGSANAIPIYNIDKKPLYPTNDPDKLIAHNYDNGFLLSYHDPIDVNRIKLDMYGYREVALWYTLKSESYDKIANILFDTQIPYLYKAISYTRDNYYITSSWLYCATKGVHIIDSETIGDSLNYFLSYPISMNKRTLSIMVGDKPKWLGNPPEDISLDYKIVKDKDTKEFKIVLQDHIHYISYDFYGVGASKIW